MHFGQIPRVPGDPILGLMDLYRADTNPAKLDLGVGVYKDAQGLTPIPRAVKLAEQRLVDSEQTKSYIGGHGDAQFGALLLRQVLGSRAIALGEQRAGCTQAPGGTGALRLAGEFIAKCLPGRSIWLSDPTWPIHETLFAAAGLDFAALKDSARRADFRPVELPGATMSVDFGQVADRVETRNVIARIPGAARPDETVMYGAHWDGYGVGTPDASGDKIYNAAVDNATGVAGLLELAHAFAAGPRPQRSVVFAAWSGEEAGLLGSTYYAANPVWPLEKTVANINVDSLLPGTEIDPNVVVIGKGKNQLDAVLERHASAVGRTLIADPAPQAGAFYRSDHFPLAIEGVPALFPAAGFTGASAASRDYVENRYHQPSDEWDETWRMDAAAADVALIYAVGRDLADSQAWPEWNADAEFAGARAASAAIRAAPSRSSRTGNRARPCSRRG